MCIRAVRVPSALLLVAALACCRDEPKLTPPTLTVEAKTRLETFARDRCAEKGLLSDDREKCKEPRGAYSLDVDDERVRSIEVNMQTIEPDRAPKLLDEALHGLVSEEILNGIRVRLTKGSFEPSERFRLHNVEVEVSTWLEDADKPLRFLHVTVDIRWW